MIDAIVVINAGSSSIKFALYAIEDMAPVGVFRGQVEGLGTNPRLAAWDRENNALAAKALPDSAKHADAIAEVLDWVEGNDDDYRLLAAGHRVVHGAERFAAPVEVDSRVLEALDALCPLAPLHQPHNLSAIRAVAQHRPQLRQVACFDTEFHQSQPEL
ncbi:MAG: acetate/propionate family kinase, partial [Burkholderiales bacterium]